MSINDVCKCPAPVLGCRVGKGPECSWVPTAGTGSSSGQGEPQRCQPGRRGLQREARWLSSLFLSPPRAGGSLSQPARAPSPRQSPNCLSLVSSSSGDIPDLDLCPVQRQRSAIRNHVTRGIRGCCKRPGVSLLWRTSSARASCLPPPQSWQTGPQAGAMDKPRTAEEFQPLDKEFGQCLVRKCALNILYLSSLGHWGLEGKCQRSCQP